MIFGTFFYNPYPSIYHVIIYSLSILLGGILVIYLAYDSLGSFIGIIGATMGFIVMYLIPIVINIIYYRRKHPPLKLIKDIKKLDIVENEISSNNNINESIKKPKIEDEELHTKIRSFEGDTNDENVNKKNIIIDDNKNDLLKEELIKNFENKYTYNEDLDLKDKYIYTGKERNLTKDYLFYTGQIVMFIIGFVTMIFQFVNVNVFNINFES